MIMNKRLSTVPKSSRRIHLSQSSAVECVTYSEGLNKTLEANIVVTGGGGGDNGLKTEMQLQNGRC